MPARGALRVADPDRAALHFTRLTTAASSSPPVAEPTRQQVTEMATAGVRAFLYGYAA